MQREKQNQGRLDDNSSQTNANPQSIFSFSMEEIQMALGKKDLEAILIERQIKPLQMAIEKYQKENQKLHSENQKLKEEIINFQRTREGAKEINTKS